MEWGKELNILRRNRKMEKMGKYMRYLNIAPVIIAMYFCLLIIFSMIESAHLVQLAIVLAIDFVIVIMLSFLLMMMKKLGINQIY